MRNANDQSMPVGGEEGPQTGAPEATTPRRPRRGSRRKAANRKKAGVATAAGGSMLVALPALVTAFKQLQEVQGLIQRLLLPSVVMAGIAVVLLVRQFRQQRVVLRVNKQSESGRLLSSVVAQSLDLGQGIFATTGHTRSQRGRMAARSNNAVFNRGLLLDVLTTRWGRRWVRIDVPSLPGWLELIFSVSCSLVVFVARWLFGRLDHTTTEDLTDEILKKALKKGWITASTGAGFDDYYETTRGLAEVALSVDTGDLHGLG